MALVSVASLLFSGSQDTASMQMTAKLSSSTSHIKDNISAKIQKGPSSVPIVTALTLEAWIWLLRKTGLTAIIIVYQFREE
jgi:hypothetical protein